MADRHEGFKRQARAAIDRQLVRSLRSFERQIREHEAKIEENVNQGRYERIPHLAVELRTFREQAEIVEGELEQRQRRNG